ncbi:hypothetical protein Tco_0254976 [Tanacetum coccineum]
MGKTLDKEKRVELSPGTPIMNNTIAWNLPLVKHQTRLGRHLFELERDCVVDGAGGFSFSRGLGTEALTTTLVAQVSFLQGQLSAALGQIEALQARDLTHADDPEGADNSSTTNNMPPKITSAVRAAAAAARVAAAAAPMTAAAVEQLIEARVSEALANHETLQNNTNGHGDAIAGIEEIA